MTTIWEETKAAIKSFIPGHSFRMWIEPLQLARCDENRMVLYSPNFFSRKRVLENYGTLIESEIKSVLGRECQLSIEISAKNALPKPKADEKCKITVPVKNIGIETASNVVITVTDNGRQVAQDTITSISSGDTEELTLEWTPTSEGNHTIKVTASYEDTTLSEETFYIIVDPPSSDGTPNILIYLFIIIAIVIIVAVIVLFMRRQAAEGKAEGEEAEAVEVGEEEPKAAEGEEAGAVVVAVEEPEAEAEPEVEKVEEAAPQEITESIQCPSCKNAFTVKFESKPVRVKCPDCGTEGVLK